MKGECVATMMPFIPVFSNRSGSNLSCQSSESESSALSFNRRSAAKTNQQNRLLLETPKQMRVGG
jgi:hypothetical protein